MALIKIERRMGLMISSNSEGNSSQPNHQVDTNQEEGYAITKEVLQGMAIGCMEERWEACG